MWLRRPLAVRDWLIACALQIAEREQGRLALWAPIAAMVGDALYFGLRREPPLWAALGPLGMGATLLLVRRSRAVHALGWSMVLFALGLGSARLSAHRAPPFVALPDRAASLEGRVVGAEPLPDGMRLQLDRVRVDGVAIGHRQLRLTTASIAGPVLGAEVGARAMVSPPPPPAYPGARDLQRDGFFDGLAGYGYVLGEVNVIRPAAPDRLAAWRAAVAGRIRRVLPGTSGAVAATLLTGLSGSVAPADRAAFRDAGLAHLLAIAGLHMGLVMTLVLGATRAALLRSERAALFLPVRQIAALAALAAGLGYLLLTGLHVPTLRSFAMAALVVAALLAGRRPISLRGWGIAALVVIAARPEQITGASFQLSFAAVLALIAGYEALRTPLQALRGKGGWGRRMSHHATALALTSLLAGTASIPFLAYHFGQIQLYFIVANLVAVPLMAVWIMPAGLIALLLMPLRLERLALLPMGWGIDIVVRLARAVAGWPAATLPVPHVPLSSLLAASLGIAWLCLWRGRLRLAGTLLIALGGALQMWSRPPDLLISADARLVAVRLLDRQGAAGLYVRPLRGGNSYAQSAWAQCVGVPVLPLTAAPQARCAGDDCTLLVAPGRLIRLGGDMTAPCDAAIQVTQSGAVPYCPHALAVDRSFVWRNGAVSLWISPSARLLTDRADRGDRPWVFLPPEQRRAALALPLAQTDEGQ